MTIILMLFPTIDVLFMFSPALQSNLLTDDANWTLWFSILGHVVILVVTMELLVGDFTVYFNISNAFWSYWVIYS